MKRAGIIFLLSILFISFIFVWNKSYESGLEEAYIPLKTTLKNKSEVLPAEQGVFRRSEHASEYKHAETNPKYERSLNSYYNNRAYHGAPPSIPHPIDNDRNMGGNSCLKCHENGGYVDVYKAYTPVTPHPEMINCRQCHVPQKTTNLFKKSNFHKVAAPKTGINQALITSPPIIPHQIQMKENCLSCHAGPSAPKEIRVSHPERINCRQCHVPNNKETTDIGEFKRKKP